MLSLWAGDAGHKPMWQSITTTQPTTEAPSLFERPKRKGQMAPVATASGGEGGGYSVFLAAFYRNNNADT